MSSVNGSWPPSGHTAGQTDPNRCSVPIYIRLVKNLGRDLFLLPTFGASIIRYRRAKGVHDISLTP